MHDLLQITYRPPRHLVLPRLPYVLNLYLIKRYHRMPRDLRHKKGNKLAGALQSRRNARLAGLSFGARTTSASTSA
jgi:hypothetical protein